MRRQRLTSSKDPLVYRASQHPWTYQRWTRTSRMGLFHWMTWELQLPACRAVHHRWALRYHEVPRYDIFDMSQGRWLANTDVTQVVILLKVFFFFSFFSGAQRRLYVDKAVGFYRQVVGGDVIADPKLVCSLESRMFVRQDNRWSWKQYVMLRSLAKNKSWIVMPSITPSLLLYIYPKLIVSSILHWRNQSRRNWQWILIH